MDTNVSNKISQESYPRRQHYPGTDAYFLNLRNNPPPNVSIHPGTDAHFLNLRNNPPPIVSILPNQETNLAVTQQSADIANLQDFDEFYSNSSWSFHYPSHQQGDNQISQPSYQRIHHYPGTDEYDSNIVNEYHPPNLYTPYHSPQQNMHQTTSQQFPVAANVQDGEDSYLRYQYESERYYSHSSWSLHLPSQHQGQTFHSVLYPNESFHGQPMHSSNTVSASFDAKEHNVTLDMDGKTLRSAEKDTSPTYMQKYGEQLDKTGMNKYILFRKSIM